MLIRHQCEKMGAKKIFVVEDDLVLLETILNVLNQHGYEAKGTYHTDGILEIIQAFEPDLLILDYMLADWNGGELCGAVRGLNGFEYKPIIIMSAYTNILYGLKDYGCDAILNKPFDIDKLLTVVETLMIARRSDSGLFPKLKRLPLN